MNEVIDNLLNNLIKNKQIEKKPQTELEIMEVLLDNYVKMPYPDSVFPYNYCLVPKLYPFTKPFFDLIC